MASAYGCSFLAFEVLLAGLLSAMATQPDTQVSNWDEVQQCQKCGGDTKLADGAVQKSAGVYCRCCANIYQMMYRHLGGLPPTLNSMTAAEQKDFWKKSSEILQVAPRNGRWALVRSSLVSSLVSFRKEQRTRTVRREFLPLDVWQKQGYDIKKIQELGEKEENPVSGFNLFKLCF